MRAQAGAPRLGPLGTWGFASRGRFETRYDGHTWTVDVDYFDLGEKLRLYHDGVAVEEQKSPATFHLGDGARIKASIGLLGMRQVDLLAGAETSMLTPVEGTAEASRLSLERERPRLSRLIGAISWAVLVFALLAEVPQLLALTGIDVDPALLLPTTVNTLVGFAALAAALERALRFKSSRWLG